MKVVGFDKERDIITFEDMSDDDEKILKILGLEKSYSFVDSVSNTEYATWGKKKENIYTSITVPNRPLGGIDITPCGCCDDVESMKVR